MIKRMQGLSMFTASLLLAGCAAGVSQSQHAAATPASWAQLQIVNDGTADVHVYLVDQGQIWPLGLVIGVGSSTVRLPRWVQRDTQVRFLVAPIGDPGAFFSNPIAYAPGETLRLTVANDIPLSTVVVVSGSAD